jgi:MSHA pilin protein MshC
MKHLTYNAQRQSGFTLVELIMVLVLIGILAVSARGAFLKQEDFSGRLVRDQLISSFRLAQQAALAKNDGNLVSVTLTRTGNDLRIDVAHASYVATRIVDAEGTTTNWSTSSLTGSCSAVSGTLPHTILFDSRGDTTQTRLCVAGKQTNAVCISPLGFAHVGDCDV